MNMLQLNIFWKFSDENRCALLDIELINLGNKAGEKSLEKKNELQMVWQENAEVNKLAQTLMNMAHVCQEFKIFKKFNSSPTDPTTVTNE